MRIMKGKGERTDTVAKDGEIIASHSGSGSWPGVHLHDVGRAMCIDVYVLALLRH